MANLATLQRTGLSAETGELEDMVAALTEKLGVEEAKLNDLNGQSQSIKDILQETGGSAEAMAAKMEAQVKTESDAIAELTPEIGTLNDELTATTEKEKELSDEVTTKKETTAANVKNQAAKVASMDEKANEAKALTNKIASREEKIAKIKAAIQKKTAETEGLAKAAEEFLAGNKGKGAKPFAKVAKKADKQKRASTDNVAGAEKTEKAKPLTREERAALAEEKAKNRSKAAAAAKSKNTKGKW